jgi:hypothetical protein
VNHFGKLRHLLLAESLSTKRKGRNARWLTTINRQPGCISCHARFSLVG